MTHIIAGYPGCGKSYFCKNNPDFTHDSDSSTFHFEEVDGVKVEKADWPKNYINHIKDLYYEGKYNFIFISTHSMILKLLASENIPFTIFYPENTPYNKEVYMARYRDRGNDDAFIKLMDEKWHDFHFDIEGIIEIYGVNYATLNLFYPDVTSWLNKPMLASGQRESRLKDDKFLIESMQEFNRLKKVIPHKWR